MAELKIYREYKLKFYLNARHYIIINGEKGNVHPHTWEYALTIKAGQDDFVQFTFFEKGIEEYLKTFQNRIINEIAPFDSIMPTLENMTDFFSREFYEVIDSVGGILTRVEASETPTRTYILKIEEENEFAGVAVAKSSEKVTEIIDAVLDEAIGRAES